MSSLPKEKYLWQMDKDFEAGRCFELAIDASDFGATEYNIAAFFCADNGKAGFSAPCECRMLLFVTELLQSTELSVKSVS